MKNMNSLSLGLGLLVLIALSGSALAWSPKNSRAISQDVSTIQPTTRTMLSKASTVIESQPLMLSRRSLFQKSSSMATVTAASALLLLSNPQSASASATSPSTLPEFLYRILRVKEATQQEIRLISTGKFKDVQRANVKLAVKFMIKNYKLSDCLLGAALYLPNAKQQSAVQVGQSAVQSLQTILEYFDSSDVQNIKVRLLIGMPIPYDVLARKGETRMTRKSISSFRLYNIPNQAYPQLLLSLCCLCYLMINTQNICICRSEKVPWVEKKPWC